MKFKIDDIIVRERFPDFGMPIGYITKVEGVISGGLNILVHVEHKQNSRRNPDYFRLATSEEAHAYKNLGITNIHDIPKETLIFNIL